MNGTMRRNSRILELVFFVAVSIGWGVISPAGAFLLSSDASSCCIGRSCQIVEQSPRLFGGTELWAFQRTDRKKKNNKRNNNKQREKNMRKLSASNDLMTSHKERLSTAGKEGTLRYTDPTMIFLGNVNLTATEDQLKSLILPLVPSPWDIAKIQIVKDWKTGISKGYAFVRFTEPVYATICLQELNQKEFMGRQLTCSAAKSKSDSPLRQKQRQEQMRLKAIRRAQNPPKPQPQLPKNENAEFLAFLDEDLIVPSIDDEDDDEDDDEVDGWEVPGSPAPRGFG